MHRLLTEFILSWKFLNYEIDKYACHFVSHLSVGIPHLSNLNAERRYEKRCNDNNYQGRKTKSILGSAQIDNLHSL